MNFVLWYYVTQRVRIRIEVRILRGRIN